MGLFILLTSVRIVNKEPTGRHCNPLSFFPLIPRLLESGLAKQSENTEHFLTGFRKSLDIFFLLLELDLA